MSIAVSADPGRAKSRLTAAYSIALAGASTLLFGLLNTALFIMLRGSHDPDGGAVATDVALSVVRLLGVLVPTLVFARQGRKALLAAPYLLWVVVIPMLLFGDRIPRPLGLGWTPSPDTPVDSSAWTVRPLIGAALETAFVLGPAILAARTYASDQSARRPSVIMQLSALSLTVVGLLALGQVAETTGLPDVSSWAAGLQLAAYFILGTLAGWRTSRASWIVLVAPLAMSADWIQLMIPGPSLSRILAPALPYLVATAAGLGWRLLAAWFDSLRSRSPRTLLAGVLLLNAGDVVMTVLLTQLDGAAEVNPIVRAIGLPAKLVLVSVAAAIVAHFRPAALVWPVVVMFGVTTWHVSGLLLAILT